MIKSVLAKIKNNIWLFICLIIGSLLITSVLSGIPIYTDGALRKMLKNELEEYEAENSRGAGQLTASIFFGDEYTGKGTVLEVLASDEYINDLFRSNRVKCKEEYRRITMGSLISDIYDETIARGTNYKLEAMSEVEEHLNIIAGRLYEPGLTEDGAFEAIVTSSTFNECNLALDREYTFYSFPPQSVTIRVRIVGVYEPAAEDTDYWTDVSGGLSRSMMISERDMNEYGLTAEMGAAISAVAWFKNVDFSGLQVKDLGPFVRTYNDLNNYLDDYGTGKASLRMPSLSILVSYLNKANSMQLTMWVLVAPVIIMLAFYTFMVSKLIVEEDRNEIASMKSRGARPMQIFARYLVECSFISVFSIILGPPLGMLLSQLIGSANGFLEFVNRSRMELHLLPEAYLYAILASLLFMIMVLIPAFMATKDTIVQLKQKKARKKKRPLWEMTFVDVILLGLSIYLMFVYKRTGSSNASGSLDPVVYFISTMFIIGAGLLFLRLYPIVVAVIFRLTKKSLPPTLYSAFVQVFRSGNDNRFLMFFLILTISLGVYSSNSARVINTNVENTAKYVSGADIVLHPAWKDDYSFTTGEEGAGQYALLPVGQYQSIEGVDTVTKVSSIEYAKLYSKRSGYWETDVHVLAIEPYNFAKVSWLSGNLNSTHWYNYINIMEEYPTTVLLSSGIAKLLGVDEGGTVTVDVNETSTGTFKTFNCYVLGIIDYWPTYADENSWNGDKGDLMVMNIAYLQSVVPQLSYDLWISKTEGADSNDIYERMIDQGLLDNISKIEDRTVVMTEKKNDSLLKALNGSFSMGFFATMIVSMIGFLIYWIMNIRKRKLQFGILRAMGLTRGKVTLMLVWEHLMTTGASVAFGMLAGRLTVNIFLPLLQLAYGRSVIPLELVYDFTDSLRVYVIVGIMIVIGILILAGFINRLKINEAVKIGEE